MIDSFLIENFRLFRRLEIAQFGRVNLFVGKNNSGKSALLEALELYASNASRTVIHSLIATRGENWNESEASPFRSVFRGYCMPEISSNGITFGSRTEKSKRIQIKIAAYSGEFSDDGVWRRKILSSDEIKEAELYSDIEYALVAQEGEKIRRIVVLNSNFIEFRPTFEPATRALYPLQVLPTQNMTAQKIAGLWDITGLTPLASEVIEGLKLIDLSVKGVLFVESDEGVRIPLVSCENMSEPIPLKSMGDGMTRLFHIIVALVNAKNGIVLIDEFENGLHWSVQPSIWKAIFRLAEQLNVQVFATTHSRDCVSSFENAWAEYPEQGAFFRLQLNKENEPSIKAYSLETLADSLDTDVEVR